MGEEKRGNTQINKLIMKKLLFIVFFTPIIGLAQVQAIDNDSAWVFTRIVNMDSTSQLKLFARANEWFVNNGYTRSKGFVNENSTGKLSSVIVIMPELNGDTYCQVTFIAKDNKYKLSFANFFNGTNGELTNEKAGKLLGMRISQKQWKKIKDHAKIGVDGRISNFIKYMNDIKKDESF